LLFGRETVGQLEAVTERVALGHDRQPEQAQAVQDRLRSA
jgi:hypothetical protein